MTAYHNHPVTIRDPISKILDVNREKTFLKIRQNHTHMSRFTPVLSYQNRLQALQLQPFFYRSVNFEFNLISGFDRNVHANEKKFRSF